MSNKTQSEAFLAEAYDLNDQKTMQAFYAKWADQYDTNMEAGLGYASPLRIADLVKKFSSEKRVSAQASVLDIGCGTGLAAASLAARGFDTIDGMDVSESMLSVAAKRGCYRQLFTADLNFPLPLSDDSYQVVVCTGTFTHGHVDAKPLSEIARILKPGGLFACTVHFDRWDTAGFEAGFDKLCKEGHFCELFRAGEPLFEDGAVDGWFCVYRRR